MRFDVLVNAGAGSGAADGRDHEASVLADAFEAAGARAAVAVVAPEDLHDEVRRRWAAADRPAAILVAGGDGTVSAAAGAAVGTDIVIGVVPAGTFNHFAQDLGVPDGLAEAVRSLVDGALQVIDTAEVNGRTFVNNSVLGAYPDMVALRDRIRDRRGWGKVRAVPVAAVQVLRRFPLHHLDLSGPGYQRLRVRTPLLFVGNGVFTGAPGRAPARHDLVDGQLGVAVAHVVSRWGAVRAVARGLLRGTDAVDDVDTIALEELTVSTRVRHLRVAVDGEVCWMETPLRYRVRPGSLHVWAPAAEAEPEP